MSKRTMILQLVESFEYAVSAGDPDDCAKQFIIWTNLVAMALANAGMKDEHEMWKEAQQHISFYAEDLSFPAQAESMKAILIGILTSLEDKSAGLVDLDRLEELQAVSHSPFDLTKLIKLCEELNTCFAEECFLSVAMLTRAILDHVPPIFGAQNYSQVANNYKGSRSFKESMLHLNNSSRKIADSYLHVQVRDKETLPNRTQVDFSNDLDVLLAEIVRLLK
jgi:hypothetical protein